MKPCWQSTRSWISRCALHGHGPAVLALLAFNLLFVGYTLFVPWLLHGSGTDITSFQYQILSYARERMLAGDFPLYNPYTYAGHPFHAMGQAGLAYPLNWFFMLLPALTWLKASMVVHLFLASLFAYFLSLRVLSLVGPVAEGTLTGRGAKETQRTASAETLERHRKPALVGALLFAYGGFFVLHLYAGHLNLVAASTWLPLIWLGFLLIGQGFRPVRGALLAAVAMAMSVLAGSPQVTLVGLLPGLFWALVPAARLSVAAGRRWWVPWVHTAIWMLVAALVGGLLCAVQWLPSFELQGLSARGAAGADLGPEYALPGFGVWGGFLRDAMGDPEGVFLPGVSRWEYAWYLGVPALALALVGLLRAPMVGLPLALGLGVSLAAAMGSEGGVHDWLVKVLPLLEGFRVPARFLLPATLFASQLAVLGAACWAPRRMERRVRWGLVAMAGFALVALLACLRAGPEAWAGWFLIEQGKAPSESMVRSLASLWRAGWVQEALLVAALAASAWAVPAGPAGEADLANRWLQRLVAWIPVAVVALGLWVAGSALLPGGSPDTYPPADPVLRLMAHVPPQERVVLFDNRSWNRLLPLHRLNLAGYDPSITSAMNQFANASTFGEKGVGASRTWALWPTNSMRVPHPLWDFASVQWAVTMTPQPYLQAGWTLVAEDLQWCLVRNPAAPPMLYCPTRVEAAPDVVGALNRMLSSPSGKPMVAGQEAVLHPSTIEPSTSAGCLVSEWSMQPEEVRATVEAPEATWAVLSLQHYPGWTCSVDGRSSVLVASNAVGMACQVEAGRHSVVWEFQSVTFHVGVALSSVTAVALATALGLLFRRRRKWTRTI